MFLDAGVQKNPYIVEEHSQNKVENADHVVVAGRLRVELAYHPITRLNSPSLLVKLKNPLWPPRQVCGQEILYTLKVNRLNNIDLYALGIVAEAFRITFPSPPPAKLRSLLHHEV